MAWHRERWPAEARQSGEGREGHGTVRRAKLRQRRAVVEWNGSRTRGKVRPGLAVGATRALPRRGQASLVGISRGAAVTAGDGLARHCRFRSGSAVRGSSGEGVVSLGVAVLPGQVVAVGAWPGPAWDRAALRSSARQGLAVEAVRCIAGRGKARPGRLGARRRGNAGRGLARRGSAVGATRGGDVGARFGSRGPGSHGGSGRDGAGQYGQAGLGWVA